MTSVLLEPEGDLDVNATPGLRDRLFATLSDEATTQVVLDLHGLGFVDSTGLGLLIEAHAAARSRGVELLLRRPPSQLQRLMAMTQTYSTFAWG